MFYLKRIALPTTVVMPARIRCRNAVEHISPSRPQLIPLCKQISKPFTLPSRFIRPCHDITLEVSD